MKVFVIYSYEDQSSYFEVELATTDAQKVLDTCNEKGLEEMFEWSSETPLTLHIIDENNQIDFGYNNCTDCHYVLRTFELNNCESPVFAVFVNGCDLCWEGSLERLFNSKEDAIAYIISQIDTEDDEEQDFRCSLSKFNSLCDFNFSNWSILEIEIS